MKPEQNIDTTVGQAVNVDAVVGRVDCLSIIKDYLLSHGFDGLQNDNECGCLVSDLMPCCENYSSCSPGYKHPGDEDYYFFIRPFRHEG